MGPIAAAGRLLAVFVAISAAHASSAAAQAVHGRVIETETSRGVPGAQVLVTDSLGRSAARVVADSTGAFSLVVASGGTYGVVARQAGFAELAPVTLVVGVEEEVDVELRLSRSVVVIEPLTVTTRRPDPRQAPNYQGVLLRHNEFPARGPRRVVMRGEPEFNAAGDVSAMLANFPRLRTCTIVYVNGRLMSNSLAAESWLETPSYQFDAVEFYRHRNQAPEAYRGVPSDVTNPSACSILALWSNQEPRRAEAFSARKQVMVLAGLVVMIAAIAAIR